VDAGKKHQLDSKQIENIVNDDNLVEPLCLDNVFQAVKVRKDA
jgi:hypothetical protein